MSNEKSHETVFRLEISGGFLLLAAASYFFCGCRTLLALLLAVSVHELGHLVLLVRQNALPTRLRLDVSGACISCPPAGSYRDEAHRAAAGPGAGLLLWLLLQAAAVPLLRETARISLLLSVVNLLPVRGLDGGQLLAGILGRELNSHLPALISGAALVLLGLSCSPGLLVFGAALLLREAKQR